MGWARELTDHEKEFCQALGELVVFWNHVEQSVKILLHRATHIGGPDGRLWSLIAHLTPVQLKDAMIALSEDHDQVRRDHLRHCALLFDREREYRNHYVHGPLTFLTTDATSAGFMSNIGARAGALRVQQAEITAAELVAYRDRLGVLQVYIGELIRDSVNLREGALLATFRSPQLRALSMSPRKAGGPCAKQTRA